MGDAGGEGKKEGAASPSVRQLFGGEGKEEKRENDGGGRRGEAVSGKAKRGGECRAKAERNG